MTNSGGKQGRVAVIGAGAAGLMAARELVEQSHSVTVFERENEVGGRCASVLFGKALFDHGTQFFTVRDHDFELEVNQWLASNLVQEWTTGFPQTSGVVERQAHSRYCGKGGMKSLMQALANGLDVRCNTPVKRLKYTPRQWQVYNDTGLVESYDGVILTLPVPESLRLLDSDDIMTMGALLDPLRFINYEPYAIVLVQLTGPSGLPEPGAVRVDDGAISMITDNFQKGVSPVEGAVTILANAAFSERHMETDVEEVEKLLLAQAAPLLKHPVAESKTIFWRYGLATNVLPKRSWLIDEAAPLVFAGDAFGVSRFEGAVLSGMDAANVVGKALKNRPEYPRYKRRGYVKREI